MLLQSDASADLGLVRYTNMCTAIAECYDVDEAKNIRDQAKAMEAYLQQAKNRESERKAGEIRIRAERRVGELLIEMKAKGERSKEGQNGGNNKKHPSCSTTVASAKAAPQSSVADAPKLSDLGISRDQSSKWQQLANVPAEEFERAVSGEGPKPSTEGIINASALKEAPQPRMDSDALWLWGRLRDFERNGILDLELKGLLSLMTDSMRDDCSRILPRVVEWLS